MKKIGKLGLTLAMVLAMAIGTTATAFAAIMPVGVEGEGAALTKKVEVKAEGLLDTTEVFNFTLEYKGAEKLNGIETAPPTGLTDNKKTVSVNVRQDIEDATKASGSITLTDLFEGIEFSAPGNYKFELSEVEGSNPNLSYSTEKYDIVVQITWNTDEGQEPGTALKYNDISVTLQSENSTKATDGNAVFNNTANENVGTLKVTKQVAGNLSNKDDEFKFTVTLNDVKGSYKATIEGVESVPDATGDENGVEYTLKHGQTLVITNLPAGATWDVTETDTKDYIVSTAFEENVAVEDSDAIKEDKNGASGTINAKDDIDSVIFTNTKETTTPMGVFMDILPYVLIAVVAAAACFFFAARRRREDY